MRGLGEPELIGHRQIPLPCLTGDAKIEWNAVQSSSTLSRNFGVRGLCLVLIVDWCLLNLLTCPFNFGKMVGVMPAPVVHFEIIGKDPDRLRYFYNALFGWDGEISPTSDLVSDAGQYTFIDPLPVPGAPGLAGGIGGGPAFAPNILFYVAVPDVGAALNRVEELGGSRLLGPAPTSGGQLVIGRFTDPEGNLVGVAGPK